MKKVKWFNRLYSDSVIDVRLIGIMDLGSKSVYISFYVLSVLKKIIKRLTVIY